MKRLIFLLKRWFTLYRLRKLNAKLRTTYPFSLTGIVSYLMLLDMSLFKNVDITILRKVKLSLYYTVDEHLSIIDSATRVTTNMVNELNAGTFIYAEEVTISKNPEDYELSFTKYLSNTDHKTLTLHVYLERLRSSLLTLHKNISIIRDSGDKHGDIEYLNRRLKYIFNDMTNIVYSLDLILEQVNE